MGFSLSGHITVVFLLLSSGFVSVWGMLLRPGVKVHTI